MKKTTTLVFLMLFGLLLGTGITLNSGTTTASASHVVKYVPKKYRHKWYGMDGDWFKLTKHSISAGYLSKRSMKAGVGFSRVYSSHHIRVYANNMPVYDFKLKHVKGLGEAHKHWHLYAHALGEKGTYIY
ncbi:hypothetical protein [Levilactobacillus paucivorans]|uniref:hypothetical protein n=1 Tax=Levilactobacillus paucivorans TaxID=616990 RepID=UPI00070D3C75|nr:hypothetical protein [Levilactobacillus paucivorans]